MLRIALCLIILALAAGATVVVPEPIDSPVFVRLELDPVVTVGHRTIDFTPHLEQEFIHFLFSVRDVSAAYGDTTFRTTLGLRARDGLAALTGSFPASPDPGFANQLPTFITGTTDLILFDLLIGGVGSPFSVHLTDLSGQTSNAEFANPIPEPATGLLLGSVCAAFTALSAIRTVRRRRKVTQADFQLAYHLWTVPVVV